MKEEEGHHITLGCFQQKELPCDCYWAKASKLVVETPDTLCFGNSLDQRLGASSWIQVQGPSLFSMDNSLGCEIWY